MGLLFLNNAPLAIIAAMSLLSLLRVMRVIIAAMVPPIKHVVQGAPFVSKVCQYPQSARLVLTVLLDQPCRLLVHQDLIVWQKQTLSHPVLLVLFA